MPGAGLLQHSPHPGGHVVAHGRRAAEIARRTKCPPAVAQKALPNPLRAAKKQMRDSSIVHQALSGDSNLGTLRGARRLCQNGDEKEKALWPLSGTAVPCQQPHCSQQTHSSNPGLAASQFPPHPQAQGIREHQQTKPWSHHTRSLLGTPVHRPVSRASGSNISYPELFLVCKMLRTEVSMSKQFPWLPAGSQRSPRKAPAWQGTVGGRSGLAQDHSAPPICTFQGE